MANISYQKTERAESDKKMNLHLEDARRSHDEGAKKITREVSGQEMKSKEKPLVVYFHRYPPEYEAEQFTVMRDLFDSLLPHYRMVYYCMKGAKRPDEKLRRGLEVIEMPLTINRTHARDKWVKTLMYYAYLPIALNNLRKLKPAFIVSKETLPFLPSLTGRLKVPMFIEASDWWWSILLGKSPLGRKIAQALESIEVHHWNRAHALVVAHSLREAKLLEQKGMQKERIRVINATLYPEVYFPCNAKEERKMLGGKNQWIAAVHGIIHPSKGYDQLLAWWKNIVLVHPGWKLMIIGGAGGESWCKNEIKRLGIENNVIMTGWLPTQESVNKHLNAADCLLVTRRNTEDNAGVIPSSLYHSMQTGKPTIATGMEGMSEIVQHKVSGYLYEPDNFESFKAVLEHIESHPQEAEKVGKAGIKRAKECFDPATATAKYCKIIDDLLKEPQGKTTSSATKSPAQLR